MEQRAWTGHGTERIARAVVNLGEEYRSVIFPGDFQGFGNSGSGSEVADLRRRGNPI